MNLTIQDLKLIIADKELELFALRRELEAANAKVAELTPKPEVAPLEAVK